MADDESSSFSTSSFSTATVSTSISTFTTASPADEDVTDLKRVLERLSLCYEVLPLIRDKLMKMDKYTSLDLMQKKKEFKDEENRLIHLADRSQFDEGVSKQLQIWKDLFKAFIVDVKSGKSTPEIADLVKKLDEKKVECDELQSELNKEKITSEQLGKDLGGAKEELANLQKLLAEAQKEASDVKAQLEAQKTQNVDLQEKLNKEKEESASLRDQLEKVNKRVKELEEEKAFHPIFDEPKIRNETLVFKPTTYPDGKVIYLKREGIYKYYFIANSIVEKMIREKKLDPTKEAKCLVRDFETHCSTDEEHERKVAEEYHMPKGEDFYICIGEVSQ